MEARKENKRKTKIPVPKEPLPTLPNHLLAEDKKSKRQENFPPRIPLKTLNSQVWPKPGPSKGPHVPKFLMNIDSKYVTIRRRSEDLDWNYNVFNDKQSDQDSIVSISDDEIYLDKENQRHFVERRNNLGDELSAVTPNLKGCLESNRVKNIKRSLKRPHSRELQGLSPLVKQARADEDDKAKRRLQFNDGLPEKLVSSDYWKRSYMRCLNRDYTVEIFNYLLSVESKPLDIPRTSSIQRACVINWLMKINGANGNPSTVQLACWYLDSILGTGHVPLDKLQLIAAACYWIAQKLNGPVTTAARLVRCADKAFTAERLLRAEKVVMTRLKFPPQPVVVQDFITYFSWYCCQNNGEEVEVAATFLSMCGLLVDKVLCNEFPSVIAAAAVRNALYLLRKKELMSLLQTCHVFKAAEKKATKLSFTCSILRRAVRTVSAPFYEYTTPIEHYGTPPSFIAQRVITAANELSVLDARNTEM